MLAQGPELAALIQTKLTLVVAVASGHNPVKASGLLFAYLAGICQRTTPDRAQVWRLNAANRPPEEPWDFIKRFAALQGSVLGEGTLDRCAPVLAVVDEEFSRDGQSEDAQVGVEI
jgi:hypothetical protein